MFARELPIKSPIKCTAGIVSFGSNLKTCPTGSNGIIWFAETGQSSYSSSGSSPSVTLSKPYYPPDTTIGEVTGTGSGTNDTDAALNGKLISDKAQTLDVSAVIVEVNTSTDQLTLLTNSSGQDVAASDN